MATHVSARLVALLWAAPACAVLGSCQVSPPRAHSAARLGVVRAATTERAAEVARLFDALEPAVTALLPDSHARGLDVWVQDEPALYSFQSSAYSDADGFWAEGPARIHLRDHCDNIERTLAHELVHASLGQSWKLLPGTLEEGLCDVVAARLCPAAAPRLRAGRLSSAAFATGGLQVEVDLDAAVDDDGVEISVGFSARMRLEGDPPVQVDPLRVFDLKAGLSSTHLAAEAKKAFYGLSFLVVERIVDRVGFEGLHDVCADAQRAGSGPIRIERLLELAGLDLEPESWRRAIRESLGAPELEELVRAHPEFLAAMLAHFLTPMRGAAEELDRLEHLSARLSIAGSSGAQVVLRSLHALRPEVLDLIAARTLHARR